jgi:hypothetical protein
MSKQDRDAQEYRDLMQVPDKFEDGFTWSSLVGALFVALLMVPGTIYMQLLAGFGVGPAARWVTVILFLEVARRANRTLKRPEVFVLFYMAAAAMAEPFSGLLWNQFFAQSRAAAGMGVTQSLPQWFAPTDPDVLDKRSFLQVEWLPAIGVMMFQVIGSRINYSFLSYGLFRMASDVERLPFPMAPIGAQGIMALVEQQSEEGKEGKKEGKKNEDNWRWRVFSVGGVLGLGFGAVYMGLPAVSGALLGEPIQILPIPFIDWTQKTGEFLPAAATGISLNMAQLVTGMVLPFFAMIGSFIGYLITIFMNPILYNTGILTSWEVGDDTVQTIFKNNIDFYFSFVIGTSIAVAALGIYRTVKGVRAKMAENRKMKNATSSPMDIPKDRGDVPIYVLVVVYLFTSSAYVLLSGWLIDWHPGVMTVLIFFALFYSPALSYVTARLEGMAGQVIQIPYAKEAAFILSGYTGDVKVWFLPIPRMDFGERTVFWRQAELTGTRFRSIWKADIILIPIILVSSMVFAQFIWSLNPIPGPEYPYAERMWELQAGNKSIIYTSTLGRFSTFEQAFRPDYLLVGALVCFGLFFGLNALAVPSMTFYGLIRGLNQTFPHVVLTQFIGALIGRFYFQRKMGLKWREYVPVVMAGFSCGMGLITVFGVGLNFLSKAVIKIPF